MNGANDVAARRARPRAGTFVLEQHVEGVADQERRRLRAALEQEFRVVDHVLLVPVREDLAARLPEEADRVVLGRSRRSRTVSSSAGSSWRVATTAASRAASSSPYEWRQASTASIQPLAWSSVVGVRVGQPEHPRDDRDRQQAREVGEQLEPRRSPPTPPAGPRRAAGPRACERRDRVGAPGVGHGRCSVSCCAPTSERKSRPPTISAAPGSVPVGSSNSPRAARRTRSPRGRARATRACPRPRRRAPRPASARTRGTGRGRGDRAARPGRAADRSIIRPSTASMPRWRATVATSPDRSPGVAEL